MYGDALITAIPSSSQALRRRIPTMPMRDFADVYYNPTPFQAHLSRHLSQMLDAQVSDQPHDQLVPR